MSAYIYIGLCLALSAAFITLRIQITKVMRLYAQLEQVTLEKEAFKTQVETLKTRINKDENIRNIPDAELDKRLHKYTRD